MKGSSAIFLGLRSLEALSYGSLKAFHVALYHRVFFLYNANHLFFVYISPKKIPLTPKTAVLIP